VAAAAAEGAVAAGADRFGLGWRPEIAATLLRRLDRVDVLEVLVEDRPFSRAEAASLRALGRDVPLVLHGTGLGLASEHAVDERRLALVARAVEAVRPEAWSEHLAFVRAGGVEIGHLAGPPRTRRVLAGTARNVERARAVVGTAPHLENVATLFDPPSETDEPSFVREVLSGGAAGLLLDLHNLLANARNHGFDPMGWLDAVPLGGVRYVHVAGGTTVRDRLGRERVLDDHLHAAPPEVAALLRALGERAPQPVTVVLERDGRFESVDRLLAELDGMRAALAAGRAARAA
jgi:uncharacterized protein (UPF0276 family)